MTKQKLLFEIDYHIFVLNSLMQHVKKGRITILNTILLWNKDLTILLNKYNNC